MLMLIVVPRKIADFHNRISCGRNRRRQSADNMTRTLLAAFIVVIFVSCPAHPTRAGSGVLTLDWQKERDVLAASQTGLPGGCNV
jgi:hypothetical protein